MLGGLRTYEYDITLDTIPVGFREGLQVLLARACASGARLAWLGLEGSFDFQHLLSEE